MFSKLLRPKIKPHTKNTQAATHTPYQPHSFSLCANLADFLSPQMHFPTLLLPLLLLLCTPLVSGLSVADSDAPQGTGVARNVCLDVTRAGVSYSAEYENGLVVRRFDAPWALSFIGQVMPEAGDRIVDVVAHPVRPNYVTAIGTQGNLYEINIIDPTKPYTALITTSAGNNCLSVAVYKDAAYACCEDNNGYAVLVVFSGGSSSVRQISDSQCKTVTVDEPNERLYLSGTALLVYTILSPMNPNSIMTMYPPGSPHDAKFDGDLLFVASNKYVLQYRVAADGRSADLLKSYTAFGGVELHSVGIAVAGTLMYVSEWGRREVAVYDYSLPSAEPVERVILSTAPKEGIEVSGDWIYVSVGEGGLVVIGNGPDRTAVPTSVPATPAPPTPAPTTIAPTSAPATPSPPTLEPTPAPSTPIPDTVAPTPAPATPIPVTLAPTLTPTTPIPTPTIPATAVPTAPLTSVAPATAAPQTTAPPTPAPPTLDTAQPDTSTQAPASENTTTSAPLQASEEVQVCNTSHITSHPPPTTHPSQPKDVVSETAESAAAVAAVGSVVGLSSAGTAMRLALAGLSCRSTTDSGEVPLALHPTQFAPWGNPFVGLIIANCAAAAFVSLSLFVVVKAVESLQCVSHDDVSGFLKFPSIPLYVFQFVFQGVSYAAFALLFDAQNVSTVLLGAGTLLILLSVPLYLLFRIRYDVPRLASYCPYTVELSKVMTFIVGSGDWVGKSKMLWVMRYASVVRMYREEVCWFIVADLGFSMALSLIKAVPTDSTYVCGALYCTAGMLYIAISGVLVALLPYARTRDTLIMLVTSAAQSAACFFIAVAQYTKDSDSFFREVGNFLFFLSAIVLLVKALLDIFAEGYRIKNGGRLFAAAGKEDLVKGFTGEDGYCRISWSESVADMLLSPTASTVTSPMVYLDDPRRLDRDSFPHPLISALSTFAPSATLGGSVNSVPLTGHTDSLLGGRGEVAL